MVRDGLDGINSEATARGSIARPDGNQSSVEYVPFPVDRLPPPFSEYATALAVAMFCDPAIASLSLLVAGASAIGNSRCLRLKRTWLVRSVLWGAVVAESGTTKTPCMGRVLEPVEERQNRAMEEHEEQLILHASRRADWESRMSDWRKVKPGENRGGPPTPPREPAMERCIVGDITIESLADILKDNPRGLLLFRDELNGWFSSFDRYARTKSGASDTGSWLSTYDGRPLTVDRKTGDRKMIRVPRASLSILGGIQPGILRRQLSMEHRESGLAARFLFVWPPRQAKRWSEADVDPGLELAVRRAFGSLYALSGEQELVLSPEAKVAWIGYFDEHNEKIVELEGDRAAAWSKLEQTAARLGLVHHCIRSAAGDETLRDHGVVDEVSMKAGIGLAVWFRNESDRICGLLNETEADAKQRRLIEWIKKQVKPVRVRDVQRNVRGFETSSDAEAALRTLVTTGRGEWVERSTSQGKTDRLFQLTNAAPPPKPPPAGGPKPPLTLLDSTDAGAARYYRAGL